MKKIVVTGIAMATMLFSLAGCYWPGPWHDRHHHDRDRERDERHDNRDDDDHYRDDHFHHR